MFILVCKRFRRGPLAIDFFGRECKFRYMQTKSLNVSIYGIARTPEQKAEDRAIPEYSAPVGGLLFIMVVAVPVAGPLRALLSAYWHSDG